MISILKELFVFMIARKSFGYFNNIFYDNIRIFDRYWSRKRLKSNDLYFILR